MMPKVRVRLRKCNIKWKISLSVCLLFHRKEGFGQMMSSRLKLN